MPLAYSSFLSLMRCKINALSNPLYTSSIGTILRVQSSAFDTCGCAPFLSMVVCHVSKCVPVLYESFPFSSRLSHFSTAKSLGDAPRLLNFFASFQCSSRLLTLHSKSGHHQSLALSFLLSRVPFCDSVS